MNVILQNAVLYLCQIHKSTQTFPVTGSTPGSATSVQGKTSQPPNYTKGIVWRTYDYTKLRQMVCRNFKFFAFYTGHQLWVGLMLTMLFFFHLFSRFSLLRIIIMLVP